MKRLFKLIVTATSFAAPVLVHAHPGHDGHDLTWGLSAGFTHPFSGADHLLATLAVGLWAAMLGRRALWCVPLGFVSLMTVGAMSGQQWGVLPVEQGIATSLLVFGVLIAASVKLPVAASAALVGIFALFHGSAHSATMPNASVTAVYIAGLVVATALLHGIGLALGNALQTQTTLARVAGGAVATAGLVALAST